MKLGEQQHEYDDYNVRMVDLKGEEMHLRVSNTAGSKVLQYLK